MGGAIRLNPIEDVVAAGEIVVGVDLEEAAALGALLNRPAWATATVANMAGRVGITLPPEVRRVVIAKGGDERAARSAWFRLKRERRAARIATPPPPAASYAEILQNKNTGRNAA
jgi:hypothetical protein